MKDKTKNTPQVLLRRALLVLLDAAIVAFSFYFALLLRADGAVEAVWWPHNRALLYENLPWIVAVYIVCFLAGGLYSVLSSSGGCSGCSTVAVSAVIVRLFAGILKVRVRCLKAPSVSGSSAASIRSAGLSAPSAPLTTHWAKCTVSVSG